MSFPRNFPEMLERFTEEAGPTWNGLSRRLGVDTNRIRKWRLPRTVGKHDGLGPARLGVYFLPIQGHYSVTAVVGRWLPLGAAHS